jgi:putative tryptophan/tyrosine transport system substrate-binding protein
MANKIPSPSLRERVRARVSAIFLGVFLLAVPLAASAQQAGKVARIGYLAFGPLESRETRADLEAFRQGLRDRSYVEGQNIVIEYRSADWKIERLPDLATELARLKVDLIVARSTPVVRALHQATTTVPIVAAVMGDPVGDGLAASLGRPGGNITGLSFLGPELVPKRVELLKQALPTITRIAALWHPGSFSGRTNQDMLKGTEAAARALGVQLQLVGVRGPEEIDRAFSTMTRERAQALVALPIPGLASERRRIVDLAVKHRLPSMFNQRDFVELGGLLSYGASIPDLLRRSATHVDKILKGAKPGDLPIEQPTRFELVINLKTAKALGLTIPPSLLQRADEVIQ